MLRVILESIIKLSVIISTVIMLSVIAHEYHYADCHFVLALNDSICC
jgi:hypothetical protein